MTEYLKYKGYLGSIEASVEDRCLYGRILFIRDAVIYEAETIPDLEAAFEESVDGYLEACEELGREPQKPFSGTFNVRVGPELHKKAALKARQLNISLNELIKTALEQCVSEDNEMVVRHVHHFERVVTVQNEPSSGKGEHPWQMESIISNAAH